jgi:hypothetical protein
MLAKQSIGSYGIYEYTMSNMAAGCLLIQLVFSSVLMSRYMINDKAMQDENI